MIPPSIRGAVVDFDEARGLGTVASEGGDRHGFHCTAIADGSRRIDVGATVTYRVVPGLAGRWEASELIPAPAPTASR